MHLPLLRWLTIPAVVVALLALTPALQAEEPSGDVVSPEARQELEQVRQAYADLETLTLEGTVKAEFDIGGQRLDQEGRFESIFKAPNLFRHEMKDDLLAGSTGEQGYIFRLEDRLYLTLDVPEQRVAASELPRPLPDILQMQNPALLLALTTDVVNQLIDGATEVSRQEDVQLNDESFRAVQFKAPTGDVQLLIHPETHMVRQMNLDLRRTLEAQGQTQVNKAALTFDYTRSQVDEPLDNERFEWTPPEDARDATAALDQPAVAEQAGQPAAMQLVGQAAPNFTLPNLADEQVTLDDLRGEVVLLDFWATWCGPCIQAMPHLQEIHDQKADEGLRLFLVNLREDKQRVEQFMNSREFDMPVLMDRRGEVAQQYHVQGIPQTVLIGRDGQVKRVFVGFGPGGEEQLKQAIQQELAAQ